jgi:hypothetical protein
MLECRKMEVVNLNPSQNQIGLRGDCPHCGRPAYFQPVGGVHSEPLGGQAQRVCVSTQCQNCRGYVLAIAKRLSQVQPFSYEAHYPLGKPDDRVDEAVPQSVARDFAEALRCQWVKASRAAAVMCRRSLQASCHALGAKGERLIDQIDDLAAQGKVTAALKDMAHEVRTIGNAGAHPDKDGLEDVTEQDAADAIEFVHEFLDHVYVMPAKLTAIRSRRQAEAAQGQPS